MGKVEEETVETNPRQAEDNQTTEVATMPAVSCGTRGSLEGNDGFRRTGLLR